MERSFVAIDVETANPDSASICQVGAVCVLDGVVTDTLSVLVDPRSWFSPWNVAIHGITREQVRHAPTFEDIAGRLHEFVGEYVVASHTGFDRVAVSRAHAYWDLAVPRWTWLDTARVTRRAWKQFSRSGYGLANVAAHLGIQFQHHDAAEDARAAAEILVRAMDHTGIDITGWLQTLEPVRHRAPRRVCVSEVE